MPATADAPEKASTFDEILDGAHQRALAEQQEQPAPTEEATPEAPAEPEAPPVEPPAEEPVPPAPQQSGPTQDWVQTAIAAGVPQELVSLARDNDQIQQYIALMNGVGGEEPQRQPTAPEPEKFPIDDDSFDATDPVHRFAKASFEKQQKLEAMLTKTTSVLERLLEDRQTQQVLSVEQQFDAAADGLALDEIGKAGSRERGEAWPLFVMLRQANPNAPTDTLVKRAVYATFPELVTKQAQAHQLAAVQAQTQTTLKSPTPAKAALKKEPTGREKFLAELDAANRRALEASH